MGKPGEIWGVVRELEEDSKVEIFAKSGFGFGDVNACLIFRKWS